MGSPITFSGFNNIDFNLILGAVMEQARQPLAVLESQQSGVQARISTFGTLTSKVLALKTAAESMNGLAKVSTLSGKSSDATAVGVSVGTAAPAGHYDVIVNQLARSQVTVSNSTVPDADTTIVASGGTLSIGGVDVTVAGDVTLQQLAAAINATPDVGVTATVVRTGTDSYRLALSSQETGAAHAFTLTNGLSGGAGLTFTDTDGNGTSGDSPADNAVNASDASILINNIAATSSSNTFADVVEGVTLTVFKADPAVTVGVDVVPDGEALRTKVDAFVKAYNALVEFQDAQRAKSGAPDAIANDPILRQVRATLRSALQGSHGTGEFTRLAEVGIEFTRTGGLTVNQAAFDGALAANGNALRELFGGTDGVFTQAASQLADFTQADGLIPLATGRLNDQVQSMSTRIAAMEARLAVQREGLLRQFIEADLAMSRLKDQSGSLAQLGSGFGSF